MKYTSDDLKGLLEMINTDPATKEYLDKVKEIAGASTMEIVEEKKTYNLPYSSNPKPIVEPWRT